MRLFIAIQLNDEMKDALTRLQRQLQRQGVRGNYTRRENPHITLVRKPTMREIPEEVLANLPHSSMLVDHISLMRSDRGKHGMIYTEL